ncbi:hypothetical protein MMC30_003245 [Trapelia coarctata]|nr:hypothetical protein [Trapelia coarctata]
MTHITHPFATLALCAVTMIFWFSGFIAVAVAIGAALYCVGICGVFAAAAAFGAFLWVIFLVDTIFAGIAAFGGHSSTHDMGSTQMAAA